MFEKSETDCTATCNFCKAKLQIPLGSTSTLWRHMKKHPTEEAKLLSAAEEAELTRTPSRKRRRFDAADQPSIPELTNKKSCR